MTSIPIQSTTMNRLLTVAVLSLAAAAAFATVTPISGGGRDLTKIPVDPVAREKELSAKPCTLAKALEVAGKQGGVFSSAAFSAAGQIELTMFKDGLEHAVVVDAASGAVVSDTGQPRFAGDPVTGEGTALPNGVRYYDLKVGSGDAVIAKGDRATAHCTGWLVNGTKFWSSLDAPGQPLDFTLVGGQGGVIQGWVDGVPGMKVGGKRKLVIPSNLGYGPAGRSPVIPPNAVLVFDIELLKIDK
jgi:FKBP-type peptidyl-prolyl cis-trans isomerase